MRRLLQRRQLGDGEPDALSFACPFRHRRGVVVGGVIPPEDVQTLLDMGAAAVFPPGTVIPDAALSLLERLNQKLGYAQRAAS